MPTDYRCPYCEQPFNSGATLTTHLRECKEAKGRTALGGVGPIDLDDAAAEFFANMKKKNPTELRFNDIITPAQKFAKRRRMDPEDFLTALKNAMRKKEFIAYRMCEGRWIETIRKNSKPVLLVCKPGTFLEWELMEKFETEEKVYLPLPVPEDLLYMLPPEPIQFSDEDEIDSLIHKIRPTAVDCTKAEEIFGEYFWDVLMIPLIKHTWNYDDFNTCLFAKFHAQFGSGKTAALSFVGALCYRPLICGGLSLAVILRFSHLFRPTLVYNELELAQSTDPELVKLINNKFQKGYVFYRADQNDQQKYFGYEVYGPVIASSRRPFADSSTESRFITIPIEETMKDEIDLFFAVQQHPDYDQLVGMLFYNRLKKKQDGIKPDQATVKKWSISKRAQQKYALLLPFVPSSKLELVKAALLKQEELESARRAESDEGMLFNAVLSIIAEPTFDAHNPKHGVATKDILTQTKFSRINSAMKSIGFYERRIVEEVCNGGEVQHKLMRRKWFMKEIPSWKSAVRRYVPFTFNAEGKKIYDVDFELSQDRIPAQLFEQHVQAKLEGDNA